ncbi:MAG: hypothetical protein ACI4VM_07520 [Anaerovoracaceae bacterium]
MVKKITYYCITAMAVLVFWGILTLGAGLYLSEAAEELFVAAALFGYPAAACIRNTAKTAADCLDPETETEENLFAWLCGETVLRGKEPGEKRTVILNLLSKLGQMSFLGCLICAFLADEAELLRGVMIVAAGVMLFCLAMFLWILGARFVRKQRMEAEELRKDQELSGFTIDRARRKAFLALPGTLLGADLFLCLAGIFEVVLMPMDAPAGLYQAGAAVRTLGILALLMLPFVLWYAAAEWYRSTMFVLEIGKGEYGQLKVEFWQYEGTGDEREKHRNKIDRLETLKKGSRYIRVVKTGHLWPVKIPRTAVREKELLDALDIMRIR